MICQHLEGIASVSVESFRAGISLKVALASASPAVSITPAIGTEGGEGNMDEAAGGQGNTVVDWRGAARCGGGHGMSFMVVDICLNRIF